MTQPYFARLARTIACCAAMLGFTLGPLRAEEPLRIFAAASLKNALDEIAQNYTAESGQEVVVSFAGSSVLARQIMFGAPADVFISANSAWMDELEQRALIAPASRQDLLTNTLVVVGRQGLASLADLLDLPAALAAQRLALAQTNAVPAGIYAKAALETAGVWDKVEGRVAETDNVRAALALVASGAAPMGIVYATDAHAEGKVKVIHRIPASLHPPIVYPVAALSTSQDVQGFLTFLHGPEASALFEAQGFTTLPKP